MRAKSKAEKLTTHVRELRRVSNVNEIGFARTGKWDLLLAFVDGALLVLARVSFGNSILAPRFEDEPKGMSPDPGGATVTTSSN